ncbi:MAG: hypothetical protein KAX80_05755 [Planctomycetes bacterium]|nr:hypothetical protein [Planctomycetota bacterium]
MKMVLIAYNEAIDDEVAEVLQRCGADAYTKWTGVQGQGKVSGPHLGSHVWPKRNNVLAAVVPEDVAQALMEGIRNLRTTLGPEGAKAFLLPVEDVT